MFDRLEGTAYYYELVSALYAAYPDQIKTQEDVYKGLGILLKDDNPAYRSEGLVDEGYSIGGFSGILLDNIALDKNKDPNDWKREIEQQPESSPMTLLVKEYESKELPEQEVIPTEEEYAKWLEAYEVISPSSSKATIIFDVLYGLLF